MVVIESTLKVSPMASHAHLSTNHLVELSDLLRLKLAELESDRTSHLLVLSQIESARQARLQEADEDDPTQRAAANEVETAISTIEGDALEAVNHALQRIQNSGYGVCVVCKTDIPLARLRVEPQALRCTTCQSLHERNPSI